MLLITFPRCKDLVAVAMSVFFRVAQALFLHLLLFVVVIIYIASHYIDTRVRKKTVVQWGNRRRKCTG